MSAAHTGFPTAGPMAHVAGVEHWPYSLLSLTDARPHPRRLSLDRLPAARRRDADTAPQPAAPPRHRRLQPTPARLCSHQIRHCSCLVLAWPSVVAFPLHPRCSAVQRERSRRNGRSLLGKGGLRGSASEAGAQHRSPPLAGC